MIWLFGGGGSIRVDHSHGTLPRKELESNRKRQRHIRPAARSGSLGVITANFCSLIQMFSLQRVSPLACVKEPAGRGRGRGRNRDDVFHRSSLAGAILKTEGFEGLGHSLFSNVMTRQGCGWLRVQILGCEQGRA